MRGWLLIGLCSLLQVSAAWSAQTRLDYTVDELLFETICVRLNVDREQAAISRPAFEVYRASITALEARLDAELDSPGAKDVLHSINAMAPAHDDKVWGNASPAEKKRMFEEMIAGRNDPRWDVVTQRLDVYLRKIEASQAEAERLLADWLATFADELQLTESQSAALDRFIRRVLLDVYPDDILRDFEKPIDVLALEQQASLAPAELDISLLPEADRESFRLDMQDILYRYELSLDAALLKNRMDKRSATRQARASIAVPGDARFEEIERDSAERWARRYQVSEEAISSIETLAAARLGGNAAASWRARANTALCPDLAAARWPSQMASWLEGVTDADVAQMSAVQQLQREYTAASEALIAEAVASGVSLHAKRMPVGWSAEREHYVLKLVAIHGQSMEYLRRLCTLLTSAQRPRLTESLSTSLRENPRTLGPRVGVDDLRAIGLNSEQLSDTLVCR